MMNHMYKGFKGAKLLPNPQSHKFQTHNLPHITASGQSVSTNCTETSFFYFDSLDFDWLSRLLPEPQTKTESCQGYADST